MATPTQHDSSAAGLQAVRFFLFDAVGTLIDPQPSAAEVYRAAGRRFGSRLDLEDIGRRFRAAVNAWNVPGRSGLPSRTWECESASTHSSDPARQTRPTSLHRPPTDETGERRRWQELVEAVFDDVPDAGGELFESLWRHFARPEHWRTFDDVPPALADLRGRGYRLGIASNFDARLLAVAAGHPPLAAIDAVFISSDIRYSKPDPRFFRAVEARLAAAPSQIALVGDDFINDIVGARAAGWHAILLDRVGGRESLADSVAADRFRINSLAELPRLLDEQAGVAPNA